MKIEENVPLSRLTTMKTGGAARFVIETGGEAEVKDAVAFAREKNLPIIPLGSGSNMLAPDSGVEAVFIKHTDDALTRLEQSGTDIEVLAHAGLLWDSFVEFAVSKGWWGAENLSGIPGTVGAAAVQNIGAYGSVLSESVIQVITYDTKEAVLRNFSNAECRFGYRTSIFKEERDRYIITRVRFHFSLKPNPRLDYRDVAAHFSKSEQEPSLSNIRQAIIEIRKGKFPPLDALGTAGSFFMNPVLPASEAELLRSRYPDMPLFAMPEGGVKVPLAWILDHVLHLKGSREGSAFLWDKQPIVIATDSGASSHDVITLANRVRSLVKEKTGIEIIPEVRTDF